jgi:hypothetical protein
LITTFQPDLPLSPVRVDDASLPTILAILDQETDWLTAAQLLVKLGEAPTDSKKRQLRELANASDGKIISGQRGYRHIRHATPDEITHAAHWLRHQAKEMDTRATAILKQYHQLPHTPR